MIGMRESFPSFALARAALVGIALAQATGCSSCVKDEPPVETQGPGITGDRKPINLKAADKKLSQFSDTAQLGDAARATEAPADASTTD